MKSSRRGQQGADLVAGSLGAAIPVETCWGLRGLRGLRLRGAPPAYRALHMRMIMRSTRYVLRVSAQDCAYAHVRKFIHMCASV